MRHHHQAMRAAAWGGCIVVPRNQFRDGVGEFAGERRPIRCRPEANLGIHRQSRQAFACLLRTTTEISHLADDPRAQGDEVARGQPIPFPIRVDGDRAHPTGPELYERWLDQASQWGVTTFEHDWLIECFLGVRGLRAPGRAAAWQEGIDAALDARDLTAQWCMASPADFAQASRLRNITSIRTSGDHGYLVGPEVFGRGYGTEATRLVRDFALGPLALHRLALEVNSFNAPAIAVYTKVGFVLEGVRREAVRHDGEWYDVHDMAIIEGDARP